MQGAARVSTQARRPRLHGPCLSATAIGDCDRDIIIVTARIRIQVGAEGLLPLRVAGGLGELQGSRSPRGGCGRGGAGPGGRLLQGAEAPAQPRDVGLGLAQLGLRAAAAVPAAARVSTWMRLRRFGGSVPVRRPDLLLAGTGFRVCLADVGEMRRLSRTELGNAGGMGAHLSFARIATSISLLNPWFSS